MTSSMSSAFSVIHWRGFIKSVLFSVLSIMVMQASTSHAHEMRPALLKLTQLPDGEWLVAFKQPQVDGRFLNLQPITNCRAGDVTAAVNDAALQESFSLYCHQQPLRTVQIARLDRTLIDVLVTIINSDGTVDNHIISANQPSLDLSQGGASVPTYLVLGMEHLLFGIDHVLFVLVLLYLVGGFNNLLKVITSFTVAHSITLGLSAFNLISVAQAPVEALVALSIMLPARQALLMRRSDSSSGSIIRANAAADYSGYFSRNIWLLAFIFGLLHGLGFAGALAEIGLPEDSVLSALFLFNVGLEIGQIFVIAAAYGCVMLLRRVGLKISPQQAKLPLLLVGGFAAFWFFERTLQIVLS